MKILKYALMGVVLSLAYQASASEKSDEKQGIECMPAKDFVKVLSKIDKLKPEKKDTVSMVTTMKLTVLDGGVLPEHVFFRYKGAQVPFHLDTDGFVTDIAKVAKYDKRGELCMQDKTRLDKDDDEDGLNLDVDMDLYYHNKSGVHTLAELEDGLADGRAHIKKIVPGPIALIIPKFKYFSVESPEIDKIKVEAMNGEKALGDIALEKAEGMHVFPMQALIAKGADRVRITGAPYRLSPMPSPEDLKE